jgi:Tfp pilus assembly protein PilN
LAVTTKQTETPIAINLLSQDEFSQSGVGKVLLWALSIGRYIVVFTELIVILSFLSRFKLDRDLTDLNEAIARQKAIILSYGDLEQNMRYAQDQIEIVREAQSYLPPQEILAMLSTIIPPDVRLEQLRLSTGRIQLSAIALSPQGFARFVSNLNQSTLIKEVFLGSVSSTDEGLTINFELNASL